MQVRRLLAVTICMLWAASSYAQNPINWTSKQLMEPATLAHALQTKKDVPVIISVGPDAIIPGSIAVGMVYKPENMTKFKHVLSKMDRNAKIVVYCGCCPFEHCPDVRPAVNALKEMNGEYIGNRPIKLRKSTWAEKSITEVRKKDKEMNRRMGIA